MDERYPYTLTHSDERSPTKDSGLVLIYRGKIGKLNRPYNKMGIMILGETTYSSITPIMTW